MSDPRPLRKFGRPIGSALLHFMERPDGKVRVTVLFDPPRGRGEADVPSDLEVALDKALRAAIDAGAQES